MTSLTVRRFGQGDADSVRELHVEAMREYDAFSPDAELDADLRDVEAAYLDAGGEFLVGDLDRRVVAMGAFRPAEGYITEFVADLGESVAEVKRMRVSPDCQRRGYGQRIYEELEARARDRGFETLVLDTTAEQVAAQRFYERQGFDQAVRRPVQLGERSFELVCYRKALD